MGYGPLVRASAGLTAQWCYAGEPGSFSDAMTVYPDHVAARIGITGVLALLIRRLRTGRGGVASVSQTEVMLSHMATQIAERALSKAGASFTSEPSHDAPWGLFPCDGKDEWCVVTVRDDRDWRALCVAIDRLDLAADPALATAQGRAADRQRIDTALEAWLGARVSLEAMEHLQAAGVPAGAMLRVSELPEFEYFRHREFFRLLHQAHLDEPVVVDFAPVRSERLADPPLGSAPAMGEQTIEIVKELLGLSDDEIQCLIDSKVLETAELTEKTAIRKAPKVMA